MDSSVEPRSQEARRVTRLLRRSVNLQVLGEAGCVFVARAVATSYRSIYFPQDTCEEEGAEPTSAELAFALIYAFGLLLGLTLWTVRFDMNRALTKLRDEEATFEAVNEAKKCVPPWEQASTITTELIAWSFKDATLIGFGLLYAVLYPKHAGSTEEGEGSGEPPEEEGARDVSWAAIATHALYGAALLLVGAVALLILPPLLESLSGIARGMCGRCTGGSERFAPLGEETRRAVRHAAAIRSAVVAVALSTAYHFSAALTAAIHHLSKNSAVLIPAFIAYILALSLCGGLLLAASPLEAADGPLGPYLTFSDKCVALLLGWGCSEYVSLLYNVHGEAIGEATALFIGALCVTGYCIFLSACAARIRVKRSFLSSLSLLRLDKSLSGRQADKVSHLFVVASVLAVGWAWEELSEVLQCELSRRAGAAKVGVIWAYTCVAVLVILPASARLGVAAERKAEAAEAALVEFHHEGPMIVGAINTPNVAERETRPPASQPAF